MEWKRLSIHTSGCVCIVGDSSELRAFQAFQSLLYLLHTNLLQNEIDKYVDCRVESSLVS